MSQRSGKVKFFNDAKGYGFIKPDDDGNDLFVHANNLKDIQTLLNDQRVIFETEKEKQGMMAVNVEVE